ncbi:EamA/RhaT family transporter [Streptomyces sp. AV19]|uniref:EamA/RhaT family transporter n=1 Tax=Streptomyces sp. AV19 TaxID=2793068 RepID=UPI0018FE8C07|nr:EamA/RhaT family transporter [Streptomyces sp. AV19]MBH1934996.1 EamA/RhaT family transporter [Streptomyces sp. AV19]MDG4534602.1 EamA/RhaT family transporter [Streptomyces sp. AV19]
MSGERRRPAPEPIPPEPIRFFGTTWVEHDGGYALRRACVAAGGLAAAVAGGLLLRLGYEGLAIAKVGGLVNILVVGAVTICTALAFRRTWEGFVRRPGPAREEDAERSVAGLMAVGFVGVFLAWSLRALQEAPGEQLRRREYERGRGGGREHP